jgi:hypothetical protein
MMRASQPESTRRGLLLEQGGSHVADIGTARAQGADAGGVHVEAAHAKALARELEGEREAHIAHAEHADDRSA